MDSAPSPAQLLRDARTTAGLSQRALAQRAGTSQPAIARYEAGRVVPDLATLERLLLACGRQLFLAAKELDAGELRRLQESVARSPAQRLARNRRTTALAARAAAARRAGDVRPLHS